MILFEDGNKLDLTRIPLNEVEDYFQNSDGLVEVLLDKDRLINYEAAANDRQYWIKRPTAREFDDLIRPPSLIAADQMLGADIGAAVRLAGGFPLSSNGSRNLEGTILNPRSLRPRALGDQGSSIFIPSSAIVQASLAAHPLSASIKNSMFSNTCPIGGSPQRHPSGR